MNTPLHRWIASWNRRWRRLNALARVHGRSQAAFAVLHKLTSLPVLRAGVQLELVEVFTARTSELRSAARVPRNYQVRIATADDEAALGEYFGDTERISQRLLRGDVSLIACCREEICAAVWLLPGPAEYGDDWNDLHCRFVLPAGAVWSYDGKGTRIGACGSLMARLPDHLRDLGIDRVYTGIDYDNGESRSGHRSLGYQSLGLLGRLTLPGLSRTGCKRWGKRWGRLPARWEQLQLVS